MQNNTVARTYNPDGEAEQLYGFPIDLITFARAFLWVGMLGGSTEAQGTFPKVILDGLEEADHQPSPEFITACKCQALKRTKIRLTLPPHGTE
jgi:hypothetical protein